MLITITLNVPKIRRDEDGREFARALVEHLDATFNKDYAITEMEYYVPKHRAGATKL